MPILLQLRTFSCFFGVQLRIPDEHCSVQRGKTKAFFQWLINIRENSEYWQDLISESSEKEGSEVC